MSGAAPAPLRSSTGRSGREEFRLDPRRRHLNHGSYGAVPGRTIDHRAALLNELEANPFRWFEHLPQQHALARAALAPFVGADAEEIAMVPNASAAASVVMSSLPLDADAEVIVTDHVYGAVAMGVARAARRAGARAVTVRVPLAAQAEETLELILSAVTARTRLLVIDQISSPTARGFPVDELALALTDSGIVVAVDGAHALGVLPAPAVRAPHVVWFGNLHKYACAPRGAAVLVAQGRLAQNLYPLIDSWGAEQPYPQRFDSQGSIDTTGFLSAPHAIDTMDALFGWDRIRHYSADFGAWAASAVAAELETLGGPTPIPRVGLPVPQQPLLRLATGIAIDGPSARALKERLSAEADCEVGVSTWRGQGFVRLSGHVYSESADIEQFIERGIPVIASMAATADETLSTVRTPATEG